MIERVYRQAQKAKNVDRVVVATDDDRIAQVVECFGGQCIMTRDDHLTGTDRLAEVVSANPDMKIIINVQGDEPLIDPGAIEAVARPLIEDPNVEMSTIAFRINDPAEAELKTLVKVVCDRAGFAMYFSRLPIPFSRNQAHNSEVERLGHTGIYGYTRECLLKLAALKPTPLEQSETLEQLRALENGIKIKVMRFETRALAIDVPEDVAKVEAALKLLRV